MSESLLKLAEDAFRQVSKWPNHTVLLVPRKGKIKCIPRAEFKQGDVILMEATPCEINKGLTSKQWNSIDGKLRILRKENKI